MTTRAKRMDKFLQALGWETESGRFRCGCGQTYFMQQNFCSDCGASMKWKKRDGGNTIEQLEAAIAYAVGEKKKLP